MSCSGNGAEQIQLRILLGTCSVLNPHNFKNSFGFSQMCCWNLRHSQPRFTVKRLKSYQHPYPELQTKAHNEPWLYDWFLHWKTCIYMYVWPDWVHRYMWSEFIPIVSPPFGHIAFMVQAQCNISSHQARVVTGWLAGVCVELANSIPEDEQLAWMCSHMTLWCTLSCGKIQHFIWRKTKNTVDCSRVTWYIMKMPHCALRYWLAEWFSSHEAAGRHLSEQELQHFSRCCDSGAVESYFCFDLISWLGKYCKLGIAICIHRLAQTILGWVHDQLLQACWSGVGKREAFVASPSQAPCFLSISASFAL